MRNIPNSVLCVQSGYLYNREVFFFFFFFMVTDRDTFGHKDKNYCAKEHGFVGDTHLPCIKRQVH